MPPRRSTSSVRLRPLLALLVALVGVGAARAEDDARLARAEAKQRARVAETFVALAEAMVARGLRAPAEDALARARALAPEEEALAALAAAAAGLEAGAEPDAAADRLVERAHKEAAKGYDRLADLFADLEDDPRHGGYLLEAALLDPSRARVGKVAALAQKAPLLVRSPKHPFVAWLSLPRGWRAGPTWPVLVSVEGAGANFLGNARSFLSARGARGWITLAPHALSCTNALDPAKYPGYGTDLLEAWGGRRVEFDLAGLLAVLDLVRDLFGGAEKVAITGFSGGGNLCYAFTMQHPDRVLACAPACANFQPGLAARAPHVEDGGPPVHIMTGADDPHREHVFGQRPGIEGQSDQAQEAFAGLGFAHVRRTMLPGVGHAALAREVWAFVDEVTER